MFISAIKSRKSERLMTFKIGSIIGLEKDIDGPIFIVEEYDDINPLAKYKSNHGQV